MRRGGTYCASSLAAGRSRCRPACRRCLDCLSGLRDVEVFQMMVGTRRQSKIGIGL